MRIKLPENFSGLSIEGVEIALPPADSDGCVQAEDHETAQLLLSHGGTMAPDPVEANKEIDSEVLVLNESIERLTNKRQRGR